MVAQHLLQRAIHVLFLCVHCIFRATVRYINNTGNAYTYIGKLVTMYMQERQMPRLKKRFSEMGKSTENRTEFPGVGSWTKLCGVNVPAGPNVLVH